MSEGAQNRSGDDPRRAVTCRSNLVAFGEADTEGPGESSGPDAEDFVLAGEIGPEGKYLLQEKIGSGGMGRVYRAVDRFLLRDVAIKFLLRPRHMSHDDFMALFWQEARVIARLDQHDHIVRILDVHRSTYPPFIVMEYLDGCTLEELLRSGPLDRRTALEIMVGAARGLARAHADGVFHRDFKPANIFVQKTGRAKLLDFGLVRLRARGGLGLDPKAVPRLADAGTPPYMAPEQWRAEEADAATDLWAMGVILYRLFAGTFPFTAGSSAAVASRVLSGEPPVPLEVVCPDAPPMLCELVGRLLRLDPSERPRHADEVEAILEAVLRGAAQGTAAPAVTFPNLTAPSVATGFWSDPDAEAWLVHKSGPGNALRYWPKMLLVVVPGPDPSDIWKQLPGWLLEHAGVDIDVLLGLGMRPGAVADGAAELRALLGEEFTRERHILFIGHGEGTQVALRMLCDEAAALRERDDGRTVSDGRSLLHRTRTIIALVPGKGIAAMHRPARPPPSAASSTLEHELLREAQRLAEAHLPAPSLFHLGIRGDGRSGAGREASSSGGTISELRPGAPAIAQLASFLVRPDRVLARESIAQTFHLDCAAKIVTLIAPADGAREPMTSLVPGAHAATQAEVFERLRTLCAAQRPRPVRAVVTGDAGVGKSTVLRALTRRLSGDYLSSVDGDAVLPVSMPLYFVNLPVEATGPTDPAARGRLLADLLMGWWAEWFGGLTYAGAMSPEWLQARLRAEPVALIFDGVDEFLTNHPALGVADFRHMLAHLGGEYGANTRLTILLGVRSTQPGATTFASDANHVHEITRLTAGQAVRQFPSAKSWLEGGQNEQIAKLLLTPLILAQLDVRSASHAPMPATRSDLLNLALATIVEQSDLPRLHDSVASQWIDALMIVASCLFQRLRGEIVVSALKADAAALQRSWEEHLAHTGQLEAAEQLLAGIRLLADDRTCDAILRRTILYPTGHGEVRFIHREWQDFLTARYLATSIRWGYLRGLAHFAFTLPMFLAAGEMLADLRIEADLVRAVERASAEGPGADIIHPNFCAVLANSRIAMSGPAMDMLLGDLKRAPLLSRLVVLAAFGNRAMKKDDPSDPSVGDVRRQLVSGCMALMQDESVDRLSRSLAWCNAKAYHQAFNTGEPPIPWPGLGDREEDEEAALELMCDRSRTPPQVLPRHRSMQIAWVQIQYMILVAPHRPISAAHYLYTVCVAKRHHAHIPEVSQELSAIFTEGSTVWQGYKSYSLVPELWTLFQRCRDIFYSR